MKKASRKKVLSFILVAVMLTSLFGFYVQAEDSDGEQQIVADATDALTTAEKDTESETEGDKSPETCTARLIPQTLSQKMPDGVTVVVSGSLPEGVELLVSIADVSLDDLEILCAYDIKLWLDGAEYSITEAVTVSFVGIEISESDIIEAFHIDNGEIEPINVSPSADTDIATLTAESFSTYVVAKKTAPKGNAEITVKYNGYTYEYKTVYLLDSSGNVISPDKTNNWGVAKFSDLPVGTYSAIVAFNEESRGSYYAYTGSANITVEASKTAKATIALTRTAGFDGGIVYDNAVRNGDTFDHVDVRTNGTITVQNQVNGVPTGTKTYNIVVSAPKIKIDNAVNWNSNPEPGNKDWEFRFTGLRVFPASTVHIQCTITATNTADSKDKYTGILEVSYSGRDAFKKAIEDCEIKKGLDFTIAQSEIINDLFFSYGYSWSAAESESYSLSAGDLSSAVLPAGAGNLGINTPIVVDTTYFSGKQVSGYKGETAGTWTFSGWDHGNFNITADSTIKGTWTFTPDTPTPTPTYSIIYNGNGGFTSGDQDSFTDSFSTGSGYTVRDNSYIGFAWAGHAFMGWAKTRDGAPDIDISPGTELEGLESGSTLHYYAVWEVSECLVKYEFRGSLIPSGAALPDNGGWYSYGHEFVSKQPEAVSGYVFNGWYIEEEHTNYEPIEGPILTAYSYLVSLFSDEVEYVKYVDNTPLTKNITLYGYWSSGYVPPPPPPPDISYTVTYTKGAHGTFTDQTYQRAYGTATPAFTGNPTGEPGYTFTGWSPAVDPTVTGDKTYTAQWSSETPPTYIPESPVPLEPSPALTTPIPDAPVPGAVAPVIAPTNTPQTGDNSNILLLALLAVLSAAGLGTVGVIMRKKKHNK